MWARNLQRNRTSGMHVRSLTQSCPTLCDPLDCSPPGSSVDGILQARMLEWAALSSSRGSSHPGVELPSLESRALAGGCFFFFFTTGPIGKPTSGVSVSIPVHPSLIHPPFHLSIHTPVHLSSSYLPTYLSIKYVLPGNSSRGYGAGNDLPWAHGRPRKASLGTSSSLSLEA